MRLQRILGAAAVAISAAGPLAGPAGAAPWIPTGPSMSPAPTVEVRWRGHRHHGWHHNWRYRNHYGWGPAVGGLAAGAVIGSAIANSRAQARDAEVYCMQRFKSYDPQSGTYLGYDGQRHPCP